MRAHGFARLSGSAPDEAGEYLLEFDMVSEHLAWFEDLGSKVPRARLSVE